MMLESFSVPELVFVTLMDREASLRLKGVLVDLQAQRATVAVGATPRLTGMSEEDVHTAAGTSFVFVQISRGAISKLRPEGWANPTIHKINPWPESLYQVLTTYNNLEGEVTAASSNEMIGSLPPAPRGIAASAPRGAMMPQAPPGTAAGSRALSSTDALLTNAAQRFGLAPGSESEAEEEDEGGEPPAKVQVGSLLHPLPPGGLMQDAEGLGRPRRRPVAVDIEGLLANGGIEAKDVAYLKVLQSLLRPVRDPLPYEAEDEDSLEPGLVDDVSRRRGTRAFADLEQIAYEVKFRGAALCKEFEHEERELVGARPGMPWTLQDGRKARHWGKHQGLERAGAMSLEVYMTLASVRNPSPAIVQAKAQLIQNYRSLHQASMDGGSWEQAWLLTGLPEPLMRKRWAAKPPSVHCGGLSESPKRAKQADGFAWLERQSYACRAGRAARRVPECGGGRPKQKPQEQKERVSRVENIKGGASARSFPNVSSSSEFCRDFRNKPLPADTLASVPHPNYSKPVHAAHPFNNNSKIFNSGFRNMLVMGLSSFDPPALHGLLPRSGSSFCRFWNFLCHRVPLTPGTPGGRPPLCSSAPARLLPCELPFPEVFGLFRLRRAPSRRGSRFSLSLSSMMWTNALFALYSWHAIGSWDVSRGAPPAYRTAPKWHEVCRRSAERLAEDVMRFYRASGDQPLAGGRLRVATALQEAVRTPYNATPASGSGAERIELAALDLPSCAGQVALTDLLLPWQREAYLSPHLILDEGERDHLPRPCSRLNRADENEFTTRVLESGLAGIMPDSELLQHKGQPVVGEFFAVPKPPKVLSSGELQRRQRLIFDRRPQNACEGRLNWVCLPHAVLFRKMIIPRGMVARGCGKDLRSFYFSLRHDRSWWSRNAAGPVLKRRFLQRHKHRYAGKRPFDPFARHRLVLRVTGMGDQNAVDLASAAHINVLRERSLLPASEALAFNAPVPRGLQWSGVYIDDWLLVRLIKRGRAKVRDLDSIRSEAVSAAYAEVGLPEEKEKSFDHELEFRAWGAELKGGLGTLGAPLASRFHLFQITLSILTFGRITKHILQQLLGIFASVLVFRRECFSSFHHMYYYLDGLPQAGWVDIPTFIADELRAVCLQLPICQTNLRAEPSTRVLATDATITHAGACEATVSPSLATNLYRIAEARGAHVRLDMSQQDLRELELQQRSDTTDHLCQALDWKSIASYRFRVGGHINLQEARALTREIAKWAAADITPRRVIAFLDSAVCVGAFSKGRSSSFRLNGILRAFSGHCVLAGIELALIWISTKANPADYPSRLRPLPPPIIPPAEFRKHFRQHCIQRKGIELFAGSGIITSIFREGGWEMAVPVDIKRGPHCDLLSKVVLNQILKQLREDNFDFVWLSPPCFGHSAAQNGRVGGPLRDKLHPEGLDLNLPIISHTNALWEVGLIIFAICCDLGIHAVIEHPLTAFSWRQCNTQAVLKRPGVTLTRVDMCEYPDPLRPRTLKPTNLMSNAPWVPRVGRKCSKDHKHGAHLCGRRAQNAAQYSSLFAQGLLDAHATWSRSAGETTN